MKTISGACFEKRGYFKPFHLCVKGGSGISDDVSRVTMLEKWQTRCQATLPHPITDFQLPSMSLH